MAIQELRMAHDAAPPTTDRESAVLVHARAVLRERLVSEFPSVPPARVDTLLDEAYRRTDAARIQSYRVLLAERDARAALRAEVAGPSR